MADSAASTRSVVFRVTGLSVGKAEEIVTSLTAIINQRLSPSELLQVEYTVFPIPSCDNIHTSSALVDFKNGIPLFLSHLVKHPLEDHPVETDHGDINFDRHFFGFTQLYYPDLACPIDAEQVLRNFVIPPIANLFHPV
jgi:protein SERAC1